MNKGINHKNREITFIDQDPHRIPDIDLTLKEIINIAEDYKIIYKILPGKYATMSFLDKKININPQFNADGLSLVHEILHHYLIIKKIQLKTEEQFIEKESKKIYNKYLHEINDYAKKRLS